MRHTRLRPLAMAGVAVLLSSFVGLVGSTTPAGALAGDGSAYGADVNAAGIDAGPLVSSSTGGPTSAQDLAGLFLSLPAAVPLLQTGVVSSSSSYSRGT